MSRLLDLFRSDRRSKAATERRPQRRARLGLEALEDRLVPTAGLNPSGSLSLQPANLHQASAVPEKVTGTQVQSLGTNSVNGTTSLSTTSSSVLATGYTASGGLTVAPSTVVNPLLTVTLGDNGILYELVPTPKTEPQEKAIDYGVGAFATCSFGGILRLFDLSDGGEVKEYGGPYWTPVTGSNTIASELFKFDGGLYMLASNGTSYQSLWQYSGSGTNWTEITAGGVNVTSVVVANGSMFMLAQTPATTTSAGFVALRPPNLTQTAANGVWQYSTSNDTWTAITGSNTNATTLVTANGKLYMLASNGAPYQTVWQYNGSGTNWTAITDSNTKATTLVAADGGLFILNTDPFNGVMKYSGSGTDWNYVTDTSSIPDELVGFDGNLYMLGSYERVNGSVWQYSGSAFNWTAVSSWPQSGPIKTENNNPTWSGYATYSTPNVTAVAGTWVVPSVQGDGEISSWVGIDGNGNGTVEQLGVTTFESSDGKTTVCKPWIEFAGDGVSDHLVFLPGQFYYPVYINTLPGGGSFSVQAGDTISAEVSYVSSQYVNNMPVNSTFLFQMTDTPANGGPVEKFSITETTQFVVPQRSSADWIVENPAFEPQQQLLPEFNPVDFTGAWATINGTTSGINQMYNVEAINMYENKGTTTTQATTTNTPITTNTPGFNETGVGIWSSIFEVSSGPKGTMITTGTYSAVATNGSVGLGVASLGQVAALVNAPATAPHSFLEAPASHTAHSDEVFSSLGQPSRASLLVLSSSAAESHTDREAGDLLFGSDTLFSWRGI